jgi:hypothetical protein
LEQIILEVLGGLENNTIELLTIQNTIFSLLGQNNVGKIKLLKAYEFSLQKNTTPTPEDIYRNEP